MRSRFGRIGMAGAAAGAYGPCTSPLSVKVKRGKHAFRVRAVLDGLTDATPAEQSWKVKKKR